MVSVIVFDLWDTLATSTSIVGALRERFSEHISEDVVERYERATMLTRCGLTELSQRLLEALDIPRTEENVEFVRQVLKEARTSAGLIDGMHPVLSELGKRYRLAVLSNNMAYCSDVVTTLGVGPYFEREIYSWQIAALKPSAEAFASISDELAVSPEDCLLIDDNPRNVEAAEDFGMNAVRFEGCDRLSEDLRAFGIL